MRDAEHMKRLILQACKESLSITALAQRCGLQSSNPWFLRLVGEMVREGQLEQQVPKRGQGRRAKALYQAKSRV